MYDEDLRMQRIGIGLVICVSLFILVIFYLETPFPLKIILVPFIGAVGWYLSEWVLQIILWFL
jgi:hypothetical protein